MNAAKYNDLVERYAEVYTRTYVETIDKTSFTSTPDSALRLAHEKTTGIIETISELNYDYPNNYVQDIRHVMGTLTKQRLT